MLPAVIVGLVVVLVPTTALAQDISWVVPEDGGTPRNARQIEKIGPAEFRIRASVEEGRSPLKHAVSRLDLICRNGGKEPVNVSLHLELSDGGKRTEFETPAGGMPWRDFIFVQSPGRPWRQVDGSTEGWVSHVSFEAVPGETKIGLGPWYTYGDFLRFIHALPSHPHLAKQLLAKSDGGREQWELTITDPAIGAEKKRRIFWHAREHAYETFSSYAMEGLIDFLLSDEAADIRRRYSVTLHPMTNVDGVAQGFEYRSGYDFPEPRGTITGRLTFEAMDRLRPDLIVSWHNWIAPRDQDVVFYTDEENGQPTARAWYLFTQRFTSPQATGHRWRDEATPLKFDWFGRKFLSDANAHQYAMKKYGSKVWGWEMPWWRRTTDYAGQAGPAFARAWFGTLAELESLQAKTPDSPPVRTDSGEHHTVRLSPAVMVLVEAVLAPQIQSALAIYRRDLEREGYRVQLVDVDKTETPHRLRARLQDEWKAGQSGLVGAVLIGDLAALRFNTPNREGGAYWHDQLCDSYYADLDGEWTDTNGNGVYDHRSGSFDAEIWVSRLKPNNPALGRAEAELIRDYFARNHAYRTGSLQSPPPHRAFVVWTTVDVMRGTRWGARPALLYGDNVDVFGGPYIKNAAAALRRFLADPAGYELGIINCMTSATIHHLDPHPAGERIEEAQGSKMGSERQEAQNRWIFVDHGAPDLTFEWVARTKPKTLFYHMLTSEPGRHDQENYLCGAYLFGASALALIAGTQHSGAVGAPNVYPDLAAGKTLGEAWRNGLNYGFTHAGESYVSYNVWETHEGGGKWTPDASMHTRAVLHGDGTLRLRQSAHPDGRGSKTNGSP